MATASNQDQLNTVVNELIQRVNDALKAALATIDVGDAQALGLLSTADDLASAPVGDAVALRQAIGLGALAQLATLSEAEVGDPDLLRQALQLGALAQVATLSDAEVGDAIALRLALGLGSASTYSDGRYAKLMGGSAANFTGMPQYNGSPIVERDTNDGGEWTRFADGTQLSRIDAAAAPITEQAGSMYRSNADAEWIFPMPFLSGSTPCVVGQSNGLTGAWIVAGSVGTTSQRATYRAAWHAALNAQTGARLFAQGPWK